MWLDGLACSVKALGECLRLLAIASASERSVGLKMRLPQDNCFEIVRFRSLPGKLGCVDILPVA